nr:hypothetical protein MIMGU_mgv1a016630mg [Ipomoea batatas]
MLNIILGRMMMKALSSHRKIVAAVHGRRRRHRHRKTHPGRPISAGAFERLHLFLQELHVVNRLVQHGSRVHLGPAGDESLQNPYPLANPLPAVSRRHALRIRRNLHVSPLRRLHRLRVDVDGLHGGDPEYHLPHCRHGRRPFLRRRRRKTGEFPGDLGRGGEGYGGRCRRSRDPSTLVGHQVEGIIGSSGLHTQSRAVPLERFSRWIRFCTVAVFNLLT